MIRRIEAAAKRGVQVRLFVPAKPNNIACAGAQRFHHGALLDAGVRIIEHPAMLHAKAFVRDREDVLVGTCNLDSWSLKRFFEIDLLVRSAHARHAVRRALLGPRRARIEPRPEANRALRKAHGQGLRDDLADSLTDGRPRPGGQVHGASGDRACARCARLLNVLEAGVKVRRQTQGRKDRMLENATQREVRIAVDAALRELAGAAEYRRSQRAATRGSARTTVGAHALRFDENGLPIPHRNPGLVRRVAKLLNPL